MRLVETWIGGWGDACRHRRACPIKTLLRRRRVCNVMSRIKGQKLNMWLKWSSKASIGMLVSCCWCNYRLHSVYINEYIDTYRRKPKETASAILDSISDIDRIHLLLAMQNKASKANIEVRDREYIDDLVKSIQKSEAHQHLSRGEIANALAYQKMLQRYTSHSNQPPSWKQLYGVMVAAGLPFVGYGFAFFLFLFLC